MQQAQMQQHLIAVSLMQQAAGNGAMQSTIANNGAFNTLGNNGGFSENSGEGTCGPQLLQLAAMAAAATGMSQQAPFPMPMQDPQLVASYGTAPAAATLGGQSQRQQPQHQAYFEGWPGGRGQQQAQQLQQMSSGMQMMSGGMQAGGATMQMGTSVGQASHGGQFFS